MNEEPLTTLKLRADRRMFEAVMLWSLGLVSPPVGSGDADCRAAESGR